MRKMAYKQTPPWLSIHLLIFCILSLLPCHHRVAHKRTLSDLVRGWEMFCIDFILRLLFFVCVRSL